MVSESEDIFKYLRLKGKLGSTVRSENVTAVCMEEEFLVLGTLRGHVYVFSTNCKLVKSYQAHTGRVNDIVIDPYESTLYSCAECGTVVINSLGLQGDEQETLFASADKGSVRAICLEDAVRKRKDKAFIIGTDSGHLLYRRNSWAAATSSKDQKELFHGAGSAVTTITWRGSVVAWADACQIRLMEVQSQTAICYLNCPPNIGDNNPFPCSLFWHSDMDLLIGWADSFRELHLVKTENNFSASTTPAKGIGGQDVTTVLRAKLVADWVADSVICSISSFDKDHALLLGYIPASIDVCGGDRENQGEGSGEIDKPSIELLCVRRKDGQILSADVLPLQLEGVDSVKRDGGGTVSALFDGLAPEDFYMLSSYSCQSQRAHAVQWNYQLPFQRGGYRNLPPKLYILSPYDLVTVKVCDVNDRISHALQSKNIRQAVYIAKKDRYNLRLFSYKDLVNKFITSLLEDDQAEAAAFECSQLLTEVQDGTPEGALDEIWQKWIREFEARRRLSAIAPYVPTGDNGYYHKDESKDGPQKACRLSLDTYGLFLNHFLKSNSKSFLKIVQEWGTVAPPLFDANEWLEKLKMRLGNDLESPRAYSTTTTNSANSTPSRDRRGGRRLSYRGRNYDDESDDDMDDADTYANADPWLLEAKALLHSHLGQYKKALQCYLAIAPTLHELEECCDEGERHRSNHRNNYQHVFDLIEKKNLFKEVEHHVLRLVQFSKSLSEGLLIRNMDQLPVYLVVQQLKSDPQLLHWYLHTLFTKAPEVYNTQEYSEFHLTQVALYAHFAPKNDPKSTRKSEQNETSNEAITESHCQPLIVLPKCSDSSIKQIEEQSDFLKFLKYSNFVPLEVALRECERQSPPLFREIVFILAKMGCVKEGLLLLLRELDDVQLAVKYIERYGPEHWDLIVDHALSHHAFLGELLDMIGHYNRFDPMTLVGKLPPCMEIPDLRQRLSRLLRHCQFQNFLRGRCLRVLEDDTLSELKQLNKSQRKAIKVLPSTARCVACGRPTSMLPPTYNTISEKLKAAIYVQKSGEISEDKDPQSDFAGAASRIQNGKDREAGNNSDLDRGDKFLQDIGRVPVNTTDDIWGLPVSVSSGTKDGNKKYSRAIPAMAHIHDAVVFFPNKVAYHISCFYHSQDIKK